MASEVRQVAIYGKGGIGKSTICCNVAAALAGRGLKVFQIGCSPKVDSTSYLNRGTLVRPTIMDQVRARGATKEALQECIVQGYGGILLAESGGPAPGEGCAGRGAYNALEYIRNFRFIDDLGVNFLIYDVIGDVVCGGFAQPIRAGYAKEIYIVTSGELMSIYSANNVFIAIQEMCTALDAEVRVGGLINNMRGVEQEESLVGEFAERTGVSVLGHIPRDGIVQEGERAGGTVIEKRPDSAQAGHYRKLAENLLCNDRLDIPKPMELEDIMVLLRKYQTLG